MKWKELTKDGYDDFKLNKTILYKNNSAINP